MSLKRSARIGAALRRSATLSRLRRPNVRILRKKSDCGAFSDHFRPGSAEITKKKTTLIFLPSPRHNEKLVSFFPHESRRVIAIGTATEGQAQRILDSEMLN